MVTPPVCFATFTAASIARANFWKAGLAGMRFGIAAFILPFVFPFSPGLLMVGGPAQVAIAFGTAVLGVAGIAAGLVGYPFRPLNPVFRGLLVVFGCAAMMSPYASTNMLIANVVGLVGGGLIFAFEWFASRMLPSSQAAIEAGD